MWLLFYQLESQWFFMAFVFPFFLSFLFLVLFLLTCDLDDLSFGFAFFKLLGQPWPLVERLQWNGLSFYKSPNFTREKIYYFKNWKMKWLWRVSNRQKWRINWNYQISLFGFTVYPKILKLLGRIQGEGSIVSGVETKLKPLLLMYLVHQKSSKTD